jgi:hypothetical protein
MFVPVVLGTVAAISVGVSLALLFGYTAPAGREGLNGASSGRCRVRVIKLQRQRKAAVQRDQSHNVGAARLAEARVNFAIAFTLFTIRH